MQKWCQVLGTHNPDLTVRYAEWKYSLWTPIQRVSWQLNTQGLEITAWERRGRGILSIYPQHKDNTGSSRARCLPCPPSARFHLQPGEKEGSLFSVIWSLAPLLRTRDGPTDGCQLRRHSRGREHLSPATRPASAARFSGNKRWRAGPWRRVTPTAQAALCTTAGWNPSPTSLAQRFYARNEVQMGSQTATCCLTAFWCYLKALT